MRLLVFAVPSALVITLLGEWLINHGLQITRQSLPGHLGDLVALLGLVGLVAMVVLGARVPWVERSFGLDKVYQAHKILGIVVLTTFLGHALLRTAVYSQSHHEAWAFFWGLTASHPALAWGHWAFFALVLLAVVAFFGRRRLGFWLWKNTHLIVYPAVALALAHAFILGKKDLARLPNLMAFLFLVATFVAVIVWRAWSRWNLGHHSIWTVDHVKPATRGTTTLVLRREKGAGPFAHRRAGQFAILRKREGSGWSAPHPFTISSAPETADLEFTIRAAGRFTTSVADWKVGTPVLCEGPYGVFGLDSTPVGDVIMISAGVGITPFLSLLRSAHHQKALDQFVLFSANRTHEDVVATEELHLLAQNLNLKVVHILSRPNMSLVSPHPRVHFVEGHLNAEILRQHAHFDQAEVLLCGPTSMQKSVLRILKKDLKVSRVQRETFFF